MKKQNEQNKTLDERAPRALFPLGTVVHDHVFKDYSHLKASKISVTIVRIKKIII